MRPLSRICIGLAAFLLVAGLVYGLTSHEPTGTTLMLIGAATFLFLGSVAWRLAGHSAEDPDAETEEISAAPTIWPLGFALSAVVIGMGLIVSKWLLVPGGAGFVLCSSGWLRDVARSRA